MRDVSMSFHHVSAVRVSHYFPSNSQCLSLNFVHEDGSKLEISLFNLPEASALQIVKSLSDADTAVWGEGDNQTVTEYLAAKGVFDAIEGK